MRRDALALGAALALALGAACSRSRGSGSGSGAEAQAAAAAVGSGAGAQAPSPASASVAGDAAATERTDPERRVAFYEAKLAASPRHYPSLASLAVAELDRAKETGDPSWLARARTHAAASMAIQANVQALKAQAQLASYAHRFAEAVELCQRARAIYPPDTSLAALEVEAQLGLGEATAAAAALATFPADDFYAAFARGLIAAAAGDGPGAAAAFARAAERAAAERVVALQRFALVSAAGALLDTDDADAAAPYLEQAERLGADDRRLRLHRAEWQEQTGHRGEALRALEALIAERDEPELRRRAARLARQEGRPEVAAAHFAAARAGYQRGLDAGERYPLEGLAYLLLEAGVDLPRARAAAEQNLEHKRDASARRAVELARAAMAAPAR
ncbi:MAG: hypothetical protein R3B48_12225 [Kofleriaceae bacterium]